MLDRYVFAVTRLLPEKDRKKIKEELTAVTRDAVNVRAGGDEPDAETVSAVLKELGPPYEMARKYTGETAAVIAPGLTDTFWKVSRIVLSVVFVLVVVMSSIEIVYGDSLPESFLQWMLQTVSLFIEVGIAAFGVIAIVFAVITWQRRKKGVSIGTADWNPAGLPEVPGASEYAKPSKVIVDITITLAGLAVVNFLPAVVFLKIEGFNHAVWNSHLLFLNAALAADVVLNLVLLAKREWTMSLRILDIFVGGVIVFALASLFLDAHLFSFVAGQEGVVYGAETGLKMAAVIVGIVWVLVSFEHLRKIVIK